MNTASTINSSMALVSFSDDISLEQMVRKFSDNLVDDLQL